jgi:predicted Na+-dependent transporter
MHGKFPAIQQNQRNSILFHETIPLNLGLAISANFKRRYGLRQEQYISLQFKGSKKKFKNNSSLSTGESLL